MKNFLRKLLGQRVLNIYHLATAIVASLIYGFPSRQLRVIGVTGTDGKTTTVNMIAKILQEAGFIVSFLSSINAQIGNQTFDTGLHTTTPSSFFLQKILKKMTQTGSEFAVLEVTSHALDQYRTFGINFETAVLTNVSFEHLDYHKTYEKYLAVKAKLLRRAKFAVLNMDDKSYNYLSSEFREVMTYGLHDLANIWACGIEEELKDTRFIVHTSKDKFRVRLNLPGRFNVYNALAAIAVAQIYKIPQEALIHGLEKVSRIPGRMEFIDCGQDFLAMVDFAHTPNALKNLSSFLRPKVSGKIIIVFGSAGERDKQKRPEMGAVADEYADVIVITREDNRSESVDKICDQIAEGMRQKIRDRDYFVITDRREAIGFALSKAEEDDIVVVTGKGHEQSLNIDGKEYPWDDRRVMREELERVVSSK